MTVRRGGQTKKLVVDCGGLWWTGNAKTLERVPLKTPPAKHS